jgi:hypothetical protein
MMRGRIVLFIVLAVAVALVGVYVGWSANTPKAVGQPSTATPADSSVGSAPRRPSGSGSLRPPAASSQRTRQQTGSPTAAGNPGGATQPDHKPATKPAAKPAPKPQPAAGPVRFGKVTTTPSGDTATLDVAPSDHRALTATFSDRVVQVGPGATEPATRSFAMTLPLTDGAKGETLKVYVQGYAFAQENVGAYAQLTLKLNGQGTARYYRSGWDDSFVEVLEVPATPATTYRLEGVVEVHQAPGTDGYATMDVLSVDASFKR